MLAEAGGLTPARVRELYEATYREMRAAGYTAVGEFHYVGFDEALAAADAAQVAGMSFVCLYVAYGRGAIERFRQPSVNGYLRDLERLRGAGLTVGIAPHSVRACPREWLETLGGYARAEGLVLHVHADEQPREIEESLEEHGLRPIELLADTGCLSERTTVVHATHASESELDLLAEAGAGICVCPTTEANLGDGFLPVEGVLSRGIAICIGSDSNTRIDPLEELRELEGIARRQELRRNVIPLARLLKIGAADGARSLGLTEWDPVQVDLSHPSLAGVRESDLEGALIFGCGADVFC